MPTNNSMAEDDRPRGRDKIDFSDRVRRAASNVLGDSRVGQEVKLLCDRHAASRDLLREDRGQGSPIVAVVGPSGQGKSTIANWMTKGRRNGHASVVGGESGAEDESRLLWLGSRPPAFLNSAEEDYCHCNDSEMESIGISYFLLDTPACNEDQTNGAKLATRALSVATALVLVIRADQIRSQAVSLLAEASEGTLVIPVINAIRERSESLENDIQSLLSRLHDLVPTSLISDPVLIDDYEVAARDEAEVGRESAASVAGQITKLLGGKWENERRREVRLKSLERRFRHSLHTILSDELPGLTGAVTRLRTESIRLPIEIAESLVGRGGPLQAAIRTRLRLILLTQTAAFWFPYRSVLGLLNLTHGAWDRVLISFSGSLPSLLGAMWTSAKDKKVDQNAVAEVRQGLQRRSEQAVVERLGPLAQRFRKELNELQVDVGGAEGSQSTSLEPFGAKLTGIETLQSESQRIFDSEVEQAAVRRLTATWMGLIGTVIFWGLLSAPVIALYSQYISAGAEVFTSIAIDTDRPLAQALDRFPTPKLSLILTAFVLSLMPTAIFGMMIVSFSQGHRRVYAVEQSIRRRHHETIQSLQQSGVLHLQWDDPLLSDAEFLLTAGSAETEISGVSLK